MSRIICVEGGHVRNVTPDSPGRKATKVINCQLGVAPPNFDELLFEINKYDEIKILVDDDDGRHIARLLREMLQKHGKISSAVISTIEVNKDKKDNIDRKDNIDK